MNCTDCGDRRGTVLSIPRDLFVVREELERRFEETVANTLAIPQIGWLVEEGPLHTAEVAERLDLTRSEVSRHLNTSSRHGLVRTMKAGSALASPDASTQAAAMIAGFLSR